MSAVLVIVTSKTCGACHSYKLNEESSLKYLVKHNPHIRLVEINAQYDDSKLTLDSSGSIHPQLRSKIKFFPSFYLFTPKSWADHTKNLQGKAMGLNFDTLEDNYDEYNPTANSIWKWIQITLKHSPFKMSTPSSGLHSSYISKFGIRN